MENDQRLSSPNEWEDIDAIIHESEAMISTTPQDGADIQINLHSSKASSIDLILRFCASR